MRLVKTNQEPPRSKQAAAAHDPDQELLELIEALARQAAREDHRKATEKT